MLLPIHTVIQGFVALITASLFLFFLSMYFKGHANWMVVYVQFVELMTYVVFLAAGDNVKLLVGESEQLFIWVRYAGWFVTCPVLLQMMTKVVHADVPSADFTTQTIMAFLFTNVMGVTSALQPTAVGKWLFFLLGVGGAGKLFHGLYSAWRVEVHRMEPESLSARHSLISLMTFTWLAFPVAFILGPELTGMVSYEVCAIIYAILDLFCKNLYGVMCWHFNYRNAYSYTGRLLGLTPDTGKDMDTIKLRNRRKSPKRKSTVPSAVHGYVSPRSSIGSPAHLKAGASPVRASLPLGLSSPQPSPSGSVDAQDSHLRMLQGQSAKHQSQFQLLYNAIAEQNSFILEMQKAVHKNKSDVEPAADEPAADEPASVVRIPEDKYE